MLADELEELGQFDRAAFVRLQVELAHKRVNRSKKQQLQHATNALLQKHHMAWLGQPVHDAVEQRQISTSEYGWRYAANKLNFHRGLLRLRLDLGMLLEEHRLHDFVQSEHGQWIEQITIVVSNRDEFLHTRLPRCFHGLLRAEFQFYNQSAAQAAASWQQITACENFAALNGLTVTGLAGDEILRCLDDTTADRLLELRLSGTPQTAHWFHTLPFKSLVSLDIGALTPALVKALCQSPHLRNLAELALAGSPLEDACLVGLLQSPLAERLRVVQFANTGMGDAGCTVLAQSPLLAALHGPCLNLMINRIGDAGLVALCANPALQRFSELVLRENQIGDAGCHALAECPHVAQLEYLDLWRNQITDAGAVALARSPYFNNLTDLCIKENHLSADARRLLHDRFGTVVKA
jgi:hypothetical protein